MMEQVVEEAGPSIEEEEKEYYEEEKEVDTSVVNYQEKPSTNRTRWIYQQVTEMSRTLGIRVPTVLIAGIDGTPKQLLKPRGVFQYRTYLGYAFREAHELYVNPTAIKKEQKRLKEQPNYYNYRHSRYYKRDRSKYSLRHVIAHELIHLAFHDLEHGNRFEDYYVDSLLAGHMVFYKHKQAEMIITHVTEPKPSTTVMIETEIANLVERKKRWQTRLKRVTTAIKKIDRKIRHLEKKEEEEEEE
jgi:hypothetical protein